MTDFLIYDLKVAALIAVFYMFYRLLLSRETFHRLNRMVLLTTAAASCGVSSFSAATFLIRSVLFISSVSFFIVLDDRGQQNDDPDQIVLPE